MGDDKDSLISDVYSASFHLSLQSSGYSCQQRCQRIHLNFTDTYLTLFSTNTGQIDPCLSIIQKEMSLEVKPMSQNRDKPLPCTDIFSPLVRLKNSSLEQLYHQFIILIFAIETLVCQNVHDFPVNVVPVHTSFSLGGSLHTISYGRCN